MPAALPLITEEDGQYVVCPEAVEMLETLAKHTPEGSNPIGGDADACVFWRGGASQDTPVPEAVMMVADPEGLAALVFPRVLLCRKGRWFFGHLASICR